MKNTTHFLLIVFACLFSTTNYAQSTYEQQAVQLEATVQSNPPQVTLQWEHYSSDPVSVFRKLKSEDDWQHLIALNVGTSQYVDNTIVANQVYDYAVGQYWTSTAGFRPRTYGVGYISTGVNVPAIQHKGTVILVVDKTIAPDLSTELDRLERDFYGDGWSVVRHDVERHIDGAYPYQIVEKAHQIRKTIQESYAKHPDAKAVLLFGHIPYIKSGEASPDGHGNRTFSFDAFYGDMDGNWTDYQTVTSSTAWPYGWERNNIGDNQFDHSDAPTDIELQVGRIDLANLNSTTSAGYHFTETEVELLKAYLDKNHAYRHKLFSPTYKGYIMESSCGGFHTPPAWKSFAPLVGISNVDWNDGVGQTYADVLTTSSYLWSSFATCWDGGVHGAKVGVELGIDSLQTIFGTYSASYIGSLYGGGKYPFALMASGQMLTTVYTANVDWNFHHMGMGENIGYSYQSYMNQRETYQETVSNRGCVANLMGDPTLRMFMMSPPSNLVVTATGNQVSLNWTASTEPGVLGYYVYRFDPTSNSFNQIYFTVNTSYNYSAVGDDANAVHMIRAVKLETTASGSFYNLSQGIFDGNECTNADCACEIQYNTSTSDCDGTAGIDVSYVDGSNDCNMYCAITGNTQDEYIDTLIVGQINNVSGDNAGYADFTNLSTSAASGSTVNLSMTPGFTGTVYPETWQVWVDYNGDGDFQDANELAFSQPTISNTTVTGSFTIPSVGVVLGPTRMRVSMQWNTLAPLCGAISFGEAEDYTLIITTETCADSDGDGTPDDCDICAGFDDNIDSDGDQVPDGCDLCPGGHDLFDSDGDGMPNGCDPDYLVPGCPPDFIAGGFGALIGTEVGIEDHETDGPIESTQTINPMGKVDYDSQIYIDLNPGFNTVLGAEFNAFIDGCNGGSGGVNQ